MKKRILFLLLCLSLFTIHIPVVKATSTDVIEQENYTYINPEYEGIISEADLVKPRTRGISLLAEPVYVSTLNEAGAVLREAMKNRETTINVYYSCPIEQYDETIYETILSEGMKHTGVSTEGDYLKRQYGGCHISVSRSVSNDNYLLTYTYTMTYYTTKQQEDMVTSKVNEVVAGFGFDETTSDYVKVKTIYDYICNNVTYDYDNLNDTTYKLKHTAYAALINHTSVCQGYAVLFYRMALECGIDARYISGTGVTSTGSGGHGWNIVEIDGKYYNLDSTWDASYASYGYDYEYFLKAAGSSFDTEHIRNEEYTTIEFNTLYPMAINDYDFESAIEQCEHNYVSTIIYPTCTNQGYTTHTCQKCGNSYNDTYVDSLGHNFKNPAYVWENQTCIATAYCDRCNEEIKEYCYADYDYVEPTCIENGKGIYTAVFKNKGFETQVLEEELEAWGHNYKSHVTSPTCQSQGYTTYICLDCGDSYIADYTDPIDHNYEEVLAKATFYDDGKIEEKCIYCDDVKSCRIIPRLDSASLNQYSFTYTGSKIYPIITILDREGNEVYYYTPKFYNNLNAGNARVEIELDYLYEGNITLDYTILPKAATAPTLSNANTGITVKWNKVASANKYYIYRSVSGGTYSKVATTTKLTYTDTKANTNGKKYQYKILSVKSVNGSDLKAKKYSGVKTIYRVIRPTIRSLSAGKRKLTVKWKANTSASGYRIYYSTSSTFNTQKYVDVKNKTTILKSIGSLKAKKKYYVRMKTYKTVNGTKYWSSYSAKKAITTK